MGLPVKRLSDAPLIHADMDDSGRRSDWARNWKTIPSLTAGCFSFLLAPGKMALGWPAVPISRNNLPLNVVSMMSSLLFIALGFILLYLGGELLVRGAESLALRLGLSPLVVGLTVVALGTSSPELFVSVNAALDGLGDVALGNVVGSNICNIALVLGLAAMLRPIQVQAQLMAA